LWKEGEDVSLAESRPENGEQPAVTSENGPIRFTRRKDERALYAICLQWPGPTLRLRTVGAAQSTKITLLGVNQSLKWHDDTSGGMVIETPSALQDEAKRPCKVAWTFRIEGEQA